MFFLGILLLILISILVTSDPCGAFIYFSATLCLSLIFLRIFRFKARGKHYYLVDFCYYANIVIWIYTLFFIKNSTLFNVAFFFAQGILSWAIAIYRNSLIFHDIDRFTTQIIHSLPLLTMSVLRWNEGNGQSCPDKLYSPIYSLEPIFGCYFVWIFIHYYIIFILRYDYIKKNKLPTLYRLSKQQQDRITGKWIYFCGKKSKLKSFLYMSLHLSTFIVSGSLSVIQFHIKFYNIMHVGALILLLIWNGANYYFEYFARKYQASLEAIKILSDQGLSLKDATYQREVFCLNEEQKAMNKKKEE